MSAVASDAKGPKKVPIVSEKKEFIEDVRRPLYCSKMISNGPRCCCARLRRI
jgi:6-phosphogluconate dehydrogenase